MNSSSGATLLSTQVFPKSVIIFYSPSSNKLCEESCRSASQPVVKVLASYLSACSQKGAAFPLCCVYSGKPPAPPSPASSSLPHTPLPLATSALSWLTLPAGLAR